MGPLASAGRPGPRRRALAIALAAAVAISLLAACDGGDEQPKTRGTSREASVPASPHRPKEAKKRHRGKGPRFHFRVVSREAIKTGVPVRPVVVRRSVRVTVQKVRRILERIYRDGFLDPRSWQANRYSRVFRRFTGPAARAARKHPRTLTLGPGAGKVLDRVGGPWGKMRIRVLLQPGGRPYTAAVQVRFRARATRKNGLVRVIVSKGQFFLTPGPRGWKIYAYDVKRKDHPAGKRRG
jgi:hypothetical protein